MTTELDWPVEYKKELLLGNLNTSVALCSLWTERSFAAGKIGLENVVLVGNLYSHGPGVEGIVRNVLANPVIRTIVVAGNDKSQSAESLKAFFGLGVTKTDRGFVINLPSNLNREKIPDGKRLIDSAIPLDDVELIRNNVSLVDMREKSWEEVSTFTQKCKKEGKFAEPKTFGKTESKVEVLTAEDIGFVFRGSDYQQVWLEILRTIRKFGSEAASRYTTKTQELLNIVTVIDSPLDDISPDIIEYSKQLIEGKTGVDGDTYNYGRRMRVDNGDQISIAIKRLKENPSDRGILINLWDVKGDLTLENSNPPCMTQVWFRVFQGKLTANFYYRSHDIASAWVKNAIGDRILQQYVANLAGISLGRTTIISASAHIYSNDFLMVDEMLSKNEKRWAFTEDPRGNFVITVKEGQIFVRHENSSGSVVEMHGKNAESLYKKIWQLGLISMSDHALYIGYVLAKAENAVIQGLSFDQDKA